jgi:hypothetical protein
VAAIVIAAVLGAAVYGGKWLTEESDGGNAPTRVDTRTAEAPVVPPTPAPSLTTSSPPPAPSALPASATSSSRSAPAGRGTSRSGAALPVRDDASAPVATASRSDANPREAAAGDAAAREAAAREAAAREAAALETSRRVEGLLAEAAVQRRRNQFAEALATLGRARDVAPASEEVQRAQEDLAMYWLRNIRVERGRGTFSDTLKPAAAVIDSALTSATGARRADLLAHSGWATFLLWRDGNRQLDPEEWYREALSLDPANPYGNAMLAHWLLFRPGGGADVPRAVSLFDAALKSGRAADAVRALQWSAYGNASTPQADIERLRMANAMRLEGIRLTMDQASALWGPYYSGILPSTPRERQQALLAALPPDEHLSTLTWAFEEYARDDFSRRQGLQFYAALLHEVAGRKDQALAELRALEKELAKSPGSLQDAVREALRRLQPRR